MILIDIFGKRVIHISRGQVRGRGGLPNDHFISLALYCKSDHEGGRGSKYQKHTPHGLWMVQRWWQAFNIFIHCIQSTSKVQTTFSFERVESWIYFIPYRKLCPRGNSYIFAREIHQAFTYDGRVKKLQETEQELLESTILTS